MKKRAALRFRLEKLKEYCRPEFDEIDINGVEIYLDLEGKREEILEIVGDKTKKNRFKLVLREILLGRYNKTLYRKEKDGVTAMKLKTTTNSRVYCKEVSVSGQKKRVIMAIGLKHKATEKNDEEINGYLNAIEKYEYEYFQTTEDAKKYQRGT